MIFKPAYTKSSCNIPIKYGFGITKSSDCLVHQILTARYRSLSWKNYYYVGIKEY